MHGAASEKSLMPFNAKTQDATLSEMQKFDGHDRQAKCAMQWREKPDGEFNVQVCAS